MNNEVHSISLSVTIEALVLISNYSQ